MSLPVYQHCNLKSSSLEDLELFLRPELNTKHPVVINLRTFNSDQQRELIGLIENYYVSNNISFLFPYPVYLITDHEATISRMPIVQKNEELPKFYSHAESRMNVKETHLIEKNKLLQIEIKNTDSLANSSSINRYGHYHRQIMEQEEQRVFMRTIITKLTKVKKHG